MKKYISLLLLVFAILSVSSCEGDKKGGVNFFLYNNLRRNNYSPLFPEEQGDGLIMMDAPEDDDLDWGAFEVVE